VAADLADTLTPIDPPDDSLTWRLGRDLDGAFAEVVSAFEAAVFTTALRVCGVPLDAEDLTAETFLRAYVALRRYSPERIAELQLRPWLITICLNLWRNQVRTASRRPSPGPGGDAEAVSSDESPEARAERHDQGDHLAALLQRLPAKARIAVVLHHVVGLPYAEVAAIVGCPEGTAKSHVRRGLDQLRALSAAHLEVLP
jgi:RNA polymerase sigma factor (sigma-70 family)